MKALTIIFAILGILGTGGFGGLLFAASSDPDLKPEKLNADIDAKLAALRALPDGPEKQKELPEAEAFAQQGKDIFTRFGWTTYGALGGAALGLLTMILVIANAGPKPVHAGLFLASFGAPVVLGHLTISAVGSFVASATKYGVGDAKLTDLDLGAGTPILAAICGGFALAAIFSLLVRRD